MSTDNYYVIDLLFYTILIQIVMICLLNILRGQQMKNV